MIQIMFVCLIKTAIKLDKPTKKIFRFLIYSYQYLNPKFQNLPINLENFFSDKCNLYVSKTNIVLHKSV